MENSNAPRFEVDLEHIDDPQEGNYCVRLNFELRESDGNISSVMGLPYKLNARSGRDAYEKAVCVLKKDMEKSGSKLISVENLEEAEIFFVLPIDSKSKK